MLQHKMWLVEQQICRKSKTANGDGEEDKGNLLRFTTVNKGVFVSRETLG